MEYPSTQINAYLDKLFYYDVRELIQKNISQFISLYPPSSPKSLDILFEIIRLFYLCNESMHVDIEPIKYTNTIECDYSDADFTVCMKICGEKLYLFLHLSNGLCPINYINNDDISIKYLIFNYLTEQYKEKFLIDMAENIVDFDCKILHSLFHFLNNFSKDTYLQVFPRKNITIKTKILITQKQNNKCNCCFQDFGKNFDIDHIIELAYFGTNDEENLQALCLDCHREKTRFNKSIKAKYK